MRVVDAGARVAVVLVICTLLGAAVAVAQDYDEAMQRARAHEAAGELPAAAVAYGRAAERVRGRSTEATARALAARRLQLDCQERVGDLRGLRDTSVAILALHRLRQDAAGMAASQADLGYLETLLGNVATAREYLQPALVRAREAKDRPMQAELLLRLTELAQAQRHYAQALELGEEAEALFQATAKGGLGHCDLLTRLAVVHLDLGNYAWAERLLSQCLDLLPPDRVARRADAEGNLGISYAEQGKFAQALEHLETARDRFADAHDTRAHALAVLQSAVVLTRSGAYAEAARVLAALAQGGPLEPPLSGYRDLYEGDLCLAQRRGVQAAALYQRADQAGARMGDHHLRADAQRGLAAVAVQRGDPEVALARIRSAFSYMDALTEGLSPVAGGQARHQRRRIYETATSVALAARSEGTAFEVLERSRASGLVQRASVRVAPAAATESTAVAQAREALTLAKYDYARVAAAGKRKPELAARARVEAAGLAYAQALERTQRVAPGAAAVPQPAVASLAAVRRQLAEPERIVTYALTETTVHAVVIGPKTWRTKDLGPQSTLRPLLEALDVEYREDAEIPAAVAQVREALLDPLALGPGVRRVLISPEGAIGRLPFALLDPTREYAFIPSASVYVRSLGRPRQRGRMLAFGDPTYDQGPQARPLAAYVGGRRLGPLPGTRVEIASIRRAGDSVYLGEEATEAAVRRALARRPHWDTVTFACHGFANGERPWQSGLALTARNGDDGYLSALEVFGLRVPTDLVVLSACDSAPGTDFRGDGMIGLAGAFMYAGAPRVLGGLWKVDDAATHALMAAFHRRWRPEDGTAALAPGAALRAAQAHVRSQPRWRHPKYWAAWVIWGNPDA